MHQPHWRERTVKGQFHAGGRDRSLRSANKCSHQWDPGPQQDPPRPMRRGCIAAQPSPCTEQGTCSQVALGKRETWATMINVPIYVPQCRRPTQVCMHAGCTWILVYKLVMLFCLRTHRCGTSHPALCMHPGPPLHLQAGWPSRALHASTKVA